jgi:hypothetical protein
MFALEILIILIQLIFIGEFKANELLITHLSKISIYINTLNQGYHCIKYLIKLI